jgi:hypothetical protein
MPQSGGTLFLSMQLLGQSVPDSFPEDVGRLICVNASEVWVYNVYAGSSPATIGATVNVVCSTASCSAERSMYYLLYLQATKPSATAAIGIQSITPFRFNGLILRDATSNIAVKTPQNASLKPLGAMHIGLLVGGFVLIVLLIATFCWCRRRRGKQLKIDQSIEDVSPHNSEMADTPQRGGESRNHHVFQPSRGDMEEVVNQYSGRPTPGNVLPGTLADDMVVPLPVPAVPLRAHPDFDAVIFTDPEVFDPKKPSAR